MNNLVALQHWLEERGCDAFVIPSTDEYLSEFAPPEGRRLQWATGFAGSVGQAVVLKDRAALFLDSRYESQARESLAGTGIEVLDGAESTRGRWIEQNLSKGKVLAVDPSIHAFPDVERLRQRFELRSISLALLSANPIDLLWGAERPLPKKRRIIDYPACYAGESREEKCNRLVAWLIETGLSSIFIADPEEVAWFLNARTESETPGITEWPQLPIPSSRLLVTSSGETYWFVDESAIQPEFKTALAARICILSPDSVGDALRSQAPKGVIGLNTVRTPHRLAELCSRGMGMRDIGTVSCWRWRKHPNELRSARAAHYIDGLAVIRFMAWLDSGTAGGESITELTAATKLQELRRQSAEFKGHSMPVMSASGRNGSLPHYVPSHLSDRQLSSHPIYWVDSGGHYYGCSTDNTVCMALGSAEPKHIKAHSLVVKALIAVARGKIPVGAPSSHLDCIARQVLWAEGYDYGHATGHGVGNFANIHEGPYIGKNPAHPLVAPMEAGMVISIEPACYFPGDFGVRVEAHFECVASSAKGFLEFALLSMLPLDPNLLDFSIITPAERQWLASYHTTILRTYGNVADTDTAKWLQNLVKPFELAR